MIRSLVLVTSALSLAAPTPTLRAEGLAATCGTWLDGVRAILALHDYWSAAGASAAGAISGPRGSTNGDLDEDGVAVLRDRGDLVITKRPFDLDRAAIRLSPNAAGGYDPSRLTLSLDDEGTKVVLADDDARELALPFSFPFYGRTYRSVFVHSDGNLTFGGPDAAGGERSLLRFLTGPPRIAAFFADLDPARGGSVTVLSSADRAAFLWSGVPGAAQINHNSFEAVLYPSGAIDLLWGEMQSREALVGLSPGGSAAAVPADWSEAMPRGAAGAVVERFSETEKLDLVAVARRFYGGHLDRFDQLVIYTTRPLNPVPGTLAFELNVRNDVRGIGLPLSDDSRSWGSASRLSSVVYMDGVDPYLEVDGFEILGHEVGHRWLARLRFRDRDGATSGALLGSGAVHWSFFLDADASLVDGNDIEERGGGRFETVDVARRYSVLDQYVMGLRTADEVPPFFLVEAPDDFRPNRGYKATSGPEAGVSFTGKRRDLRIDDVVAAMGPRVPPRSSEPLRQAYILVADDQAPDTEPRRRAVARIRSRFEAFYLEATGGRGLIETDLR
jgi:hypothetical protein